METISNYIDGQLRSSESGKTLDCFEPATGRVYLQLPASTERDVESAVNAAECAFPAWSALSSRERATYLRAISNKILEKKAELARAESKDSGKTIKSAEAIDIPRAAANFEFFADLSTQWGGESYSMKTPGRDSRALSYVLREPLGVVAAISPWNLPLYLLTWKIAPALAAGNTVVAKPSEVTPMTAFLLSKIANEVGLPKGVLNIVHGSGSEAGARLCEHKTVKAITFTGSTSTGRAIAQSAAPTFKKIALEMGGKNPLIVFEDADLNLAAEIAAKASFSNQGQICLCSSRLYVQETVYEQFKKLLLEKIKLLKVGDPNDPTSELGAMVSKQHFDKVMGYLDLARSEGGRVLAGGGAVRVPGRCENGWFIAPTLVEGLSNECRTNQEEIFGPIATIQAFQTEQEALALANQSQYGLAGTVISQNLDRAHRVASLLKTGLVWINTWMLRDLRVPFGGQKQSGFGKEGGEEAMRFFTEPKSITLEVQSHVK